jgi:hypothetical protein
MTGEENRKLTFEANRKAISFCTGYLAGRPDAQARLISSLAFEMFKYDTDGLVRLKYEGSLLELTAHLTAAEAMFEEARVREGLTP